MTKDAYLATWRLHARGREHLCIVDEARRIVEKSLEHGQMMVSWSGGKDSTAMALLVKSVVPESPVVTQFDDCDWPEKQPYVQAVAKQMGWQVHEVHPDFSIWEAASRCNLTVESLCSPSHDLTKDGFLRLLENERKRLDCSGSFIGLRMQESRARKMNLLVRGPLYAVSGVWRCIPLARWSARDSFAYIVSQGCEINPCYWHNQLRKPEDIRISWALPTPAGTAHGDMEYLRRHHPKQWARIREAMANREVSREPD